MASLGSLTTMMFPAVLAESPLLLVATTANAWQRWEYKADATQQWKELWGLERGPGARRGHSLVLHHKPATDTENLFFALLVPETTGLPLEEISPLFDAPRELVRRNLAALGVLRTAAPK